MSSDAAMDELEVANSEGAEMSGSEAEDRVEAEASTAGPREVSPEFLARFLIPARIAYAEALERRGQGVVVEYKKMMEEVREKGMQYIEEHEHPEQHLEYADPRFKPYRLFTKALFRYALSEKAKMDKEGMQRIVCLPHNGKYGEEHIKILNLCWDDKKIVQGIQRIFRNSMYLATKEMQYFFDLISKEAGNYMANMGWDGDINVIDRITWNLRDYFRTHFFSSSLLEKYENTRTGAFMILLKFIADSAIFAAKNKRSISWRRIMYLSIQRIQQYQ